MRISRTDFKKISLLKCQNTCKAQQMRKYSKGIIYYKAMDKNKNLKAEFK